MLDLAPCQNKARALNGNVQPLRPKGQLAAQRAALDSFGAGVWDQLAELTLPVLVANGAHDVMISAFASYAMSQRLPHAKVILYSDAGHAFLFQHVEDFSHEVVRFLR